MHDAVSLPRAAAATAKPDIYESIMGLVETAFPTIKTYLSWEDELSDLGPIAPEWC